MIDEGTSVVTPYVTVQKVDDAVLKRFLELVEDANPEDLAKLLESWAKYIAARRNSDIFERGESEEERQSRAEREAIAKAMEI